MFEASSFVALVFLVDFAKALPSSFCILIGLTCNRVQLKYTIIL